MKMTCSKQKEKMQWETGRVSGTREAPTSVFVRAHHCWNDEKAQPSGT